MGKDSLADKAMDNAIRAHRIAELTLAEMDSHPSGAVRENKTGKGKQHLLFVGFPHTLTEVAKHMDNPLGRNWEKGLPLSSYADAAIRHLLGYLSGDEEPHHLRAAIWNLLCLSETDHRVQIGTIPSECDDIDRSKKSEIQYENTSPGE